MVVFVISTQENDEGHDWWDELIGNIYWLLLVILIIMILAVFMLSRDTVGNLRSIGSKKAPAVKSPNTSLEAMQAASEALLASAFPVSGEMSGLDFSIMPPRVAIVKRYGMMLDSLKSWRMVPILPNMTAREISDMLRKIGYPPDETQRVTKGFERALYSAQETTPSDWNEFSSAADSVQFFYGGAA